MAGEMLVDENQRMADEKRRAKLAQRMQERSVVHVRPSAARVLPVTSRRNRCRGSSRPGSERIGTDRRTGRRR